MNALRIWIVGIKSLLLHPLRSLLTVLGIFIGVAAAVGAIAVGVRLAAWQARQSATCTYANPSKLPDGKLAPQR